MEKGNKDILPIIRKDRSLKDFIHSKKMLAWDMGKRIAKILGASVVATAGITVWGAKLPVAVTTMGLSVFGYSVYRACWNLAYRIESDLMFVSGGIKFGEKKIIQDARFGVETKMKDYTVGEKARNDGITNVSWVFTL